MTDETFWRRHALITGKITVFSVEVVWHKFIRKFQKRDVDSHPIYLLIDVV